MVTGVAISAQRTVTTDDRGNYEIGNLPPGRYVVRASKAGYLTSPYGGRGTTPIDLAERQTLGSINVSLLRGGVIEGRVVDEHGEPAVEAQVRLVRYVGGVPQPNYTASTSTDDLGRFRLHGLVANTYYLLVTPRTDDNTVWKYTFFPATPVPSEAQPIQLGPAQEVSGVTVQLAAGRLATISGTVTSSDGQPAQLEWVRLSGGMATIRTSRFAGGFAAHNVAPGKYTLTVRTEAGEAAQVPVTVEDSDLTLSLVTTTGGTVNGRIAFEPGPPPGTRPDNVGLGFQMMAASSGDDPRIAEDWSFTAQNVVGSGVLYASPRANANAPAWVLKGVFQRGVDITDTPIEFSKGVDDLEVVLTTRVTSITGTVADRRGALVRDATVVLFPDDREKWTVRRFITTARPSQSGQFTVRALPPGKYLITAVDIFNSGDERDPQVLERLRQSATNLTLSEGDQRSIALKLTEQ